MPATPVPATPVLATPVPPLPPTLAAEPPITPLGAPVVLSETPQVHLPGATAVGLARARWLFIDDGNALWLVDGGRLARKRLARKASGPPQRLLVPRRVPASQREIDLVTTADGLAELGLMVGRFSPAELAVRAVPSSLQDVDPVDLLKIAIRALLDGTDVRAAWGEQLPPVVPVSLDVLDGIDWREGTVQRLPLPA